MIKTISTKFIKTYVGYTNDVTKRLAKHNSGTGAKSTKGHKWLLIYKKCFKTKKQAMSYEYKLKKDRKKRKIILENYHK